MWCGCGERECRRWGGPATRSTSRSAAPCARESRRTETEKTSSGAIDATCACIYVSHTTQTWISERTHEQTATTLSSRSFRALCVLPLFVACYNISNLPEGKDEPVRVIATALVALHVALAFLASPRVLTCSRVGLCCCFCSGIASLVRILWREKRNRAVNRGVKPSRASEVGGPRALRELTARTMLPQRPQRLRPVQVPQQQRRQHPHRRAHMARNQAALLPLLLLLLPLPRSPAAVCVPTRSTSLCGAWKEAGTSTCRAPASSTGLSFRGWRAAKWSAWIASRRSGTS